jgi:hypothetical protein
MVLLSAALTGFFFKMLNPVQRVVMAGSALGCFILSAHRDLVGRPFIPAAAALMILSFFLWLIFQPRRPDPVNS